MTLIDPVPVKVKAGTQPGTTQKVKGRGIAGTNGLGVDLFVARRDAREAMQRARRERRVDLVPLDPRRARR